MSTSATPAPRAETDITLERGAVTLREILRASLDEDTAEDVKGLGIDLETTAGDAQEIVTEDRAQLLALADRLLRRLAADEAHVDEITAAAKKEVALLTERYARAAKPAQRAATWKRQALEQLARILFPDPKAKPKSVNLPYGSLGRKDYAGAPELMDEGQALSYCVLHHPDRIQSTLSAPLNVLRQYLTNIVATARLTETDPRDIVDALLAELATGDNLTGVAAPLAHVLAWGSAKKLVAQGVTIDGVVVSAPRTVFFSEITGGE